MFYVTLNTLTFFLLLPHSSIAIYCSKAPLNARQKKQKSSIIFHECDHQVDNDDVIKNREGHGESNTQTHTL